MFKVLQKTIRPISSSCCLICKANKIHYNFSIGTFRVEECMNCGMMRLNPQPTDEELAKIYNANYFLIDKENAENQSHVLLLKSKTAVHYLNLLKSYVGAPLVGELLEIGCGHGDFLCQAADRGLNVTGIEYSSDAANIAASKISDRGYVITGEITQLVNQKKQFDYVVFSDVLEHVRDPREFLNHTHSLLKDGGVAVAIVPTLDSFSARWMKNNWPEFKYEHLWYFSRQTLRRLFYSEGFENIRVQKDIKTLSIEYIADHFERYTVPFFTRVLQLLRRLLPYAVRRYPLHVGAGGIIIFCSKKPKSPTKKLSIVMAVFNEEKTIQTVIEKILAKKIDNIEFELIIVESRSTDNTREILCQYATNPRIKIIWQENPYGKGNAIRSGLEHVTGEFILIQDADEEYDFEDYDALMEPLLSGEADFVLGARHGGRAWKMRKFSNQRFVGYILNIGHLFFTLLVNVFFGLRLKDPFTMYNVFRTDCLRGLKFECNRFDFDFELVIKLFKNGYRPIEIPVNYRSRSFVEGKKIKVFKDPL